MTLTRAGLCFLIALILFAIAFLWDFAPSPAFASGRITTLGFVFVAAGLMLSQ
jgi:uncharacterized membrane protein